MWFWPMCRAPALVSSARNRIFAGRIRRSWHSCPAVQLSILNNVSAYVRPGGVLVYATCTVLPEENGGVVSAFLDVHPDFAKEEFTLPGIGSCPGDVTLWPQRTGTDGFYICRMRRRG